MSDYTIDEKAVTSDAAAIMRAIRPAGWTPEQIGKVVGGLRWWHRRGYREGQIEAGLHHVQTEDIRLLIAELETANEWCANFIPAAKIIARLEALRPWIQRRFQCRRVRGSRESAGGDL